MLVTKLTAVLIAIGSPIPGNPRLNGRNAWVIKITIRTTIETPENASTATV